VAAVTIQISREGGDPHDVALTRSRKTATVWIDGVPCPVTFAAAGAATILEIGGRHETVWCVTERDTVFVHAFGRAWTLQVRDPVEGAGRGDRSADAAVAHMPGVLVALAVAPGDAVAGGQVVAVIESMKMHSEIQAPRDGTVDRVLVAVGENFDRGAPLVTLEPAPAGDQQPEEH
jgi:biotin carboxyl carrier protein